MRGTVVAGVWGAGKSTLLSHLPDALRAADADSYICLPQGATTYPDLRAASDAERARHVLAWMDVTVSMLEAMNDRYAHMEMAPHLDPERAALTVVLEGFTFDAPLYHAGIDRRDVAGLERRLAALGFEVVLLRVPREQILERCINSTITQRGEGWEKWLLAHAADRERLVALIETRQAGLERAVRDSPLPHRIVDATSHAPADLARELVTRPLRRIAGPEGNSL